MDNRTESKIQSDISDQASNQLSRKIKFAYYFIVGIGIPLFVFFYGNVINIDVAWVLSLSTIAYFYMGAIDSSEHNNCSGIYPQWFRWFYLRSVSNFPRVAKLSYFFLFVFIWPMLWFMSDNSNPPISLQDAIKIEGTIVRIPQKNTGNSGISVQSKDGVIHSVNMATLSGIRKKLVEIKEKKTTITLLCQKVTDFDGTYLRIMEATCEGSKLIRYNYDRRVNSYELFLLVEKIFRYVNIFLLTLLILLCLTSNIMGDNKCRR